LLPHTACRARLRLHPPYFLFLVLPAPPTSPLFPYTTLFRSRPSQLLDRAECVFTRQPADDATERRREPTHVLAQLCVLRPGRARSEEHTSELQSPDHLVCRLLLEKKKIQSNTQATLTYQRQG